MKKVILTIALFASVAVAMAQTKKKPEVKPTIIVSSIMDDTLQRTQFYKDMGIRIQAMQSLMYILAKPGDVTPNQSQGVFKLADSLVKVDVSLYQKNEAVKQKAKQPIKIPAKQ